MKARPPALVPLRLGGALLDNRIAAAQLQLDDDPMPAGPPVPPAVRGHQGISLRVVR